MRALAVFPARRESRVIDHPEPRISGPTEVRLRMLEVGVCGTDREIAAFEYGTPPPGSDYLIIGHESLAEVVETGADASRVRQGDLAVVMVRRPCPHPNCLACRSARQDFCYTGDYVERGIKGIHGFMTEFIADDECFLTPVPSALRDVAVLAEPLTIAEKAIAQIWQVQRRLPWAGAGVRHKAVVLGAGPVGLLGAMALAGQGFETWVYSREAAPSPGSRVSDAIGAHYISSADHTIEQLAKEIGDIEVVYEATGASRLAFAVLEVLAPNAVFVFTGVPGRRAPVQVDTDLIMRRLVLNNQVVFGTVNAGRESYEAAVRDLGIFLERWPDALRSLITARIPLERAGEALSTPRGGIKTVVSFGR